MNTGELKDYFRMVVDEPDVSFLTDTQINMFLKLGFEEYRNIVYSESPADIISTANFTVSGVKSIDLTSVIPDGGAPTDVLLGSNASAPMLSLWKIAIIDGSGDTTYYMDITRDEETIPSEYNPLVGSSTAWLEGSLLRFGGSISATLKFYYLKASAVDWTAPTDFIDNFPQFHHVIALKAAKHYSIIDNGINEQLEQKTAKFEQEMREYFQVTRTPRGAQYVSED